MIYRNVFLLTCLIFCLTTCSYLKNVGLLTNGKIERNGFVQAIPFEYKKGLIVVKARVNSDTTDSEFIFDTGAFNSKIEKEFAERLGLPAVTYKTNSDSNGNSKTIEVTRIDSLFLGETRFSSIGAGKVEYDRKSASPCVAANGIIGANLIKLAHWKVDFENKILYFSDSPFVPDFGLATHELPFKRPLLSGVPIISLSLNGIEIKGVTFDLGYNGGLILPAELAKEFPESEKEVIIDQSTSGIYGTRVDTIVSQHLELDLGGNKSYISVDFSANGKILLGNEILEHFHVFFDYEKQKILLQRKTDIQISPNPYFIPGILNDTLWSVNRVRLGQALKLGDTLRAINGMQPKDLYSNYCDYFLGIRDMLDQDTLSITKLDGLKVSLY